MIYFVQVPFSNTDKFRRYAIKNSLGLQKSSLQFGGDRMFSMFYVTMDDEQAVVMKLKLDFIKIIKPKKEDNRQSIQ